MKKTVALMGLLLSSMAFAGNVEKVRDVCQIIASEKPAEHACGLQACTEGVLCDWDCVERYVGDDTKYKLCVSKCWKKAATDYVNACR